MPGTSDECNERQQGFGLLALGAMAEPTRRVGEMLRALSIPRLIYAVTEVYGGDPERTRRVDPLWDYVARDIKTPRSERYRLTIPYAQAIQCIDTYFRAVDYRYPGLKRDDVLQSVETLCAEDADFGHGSGARPNPASIFVLMMIIAIVPLIAEGYSEAHGSFISIHMLSRALQLLEDVFGDDDGPEIIQCLRLLVIYSIYSSAAGSSWHLSGFAMKKCVALGYHREPEVLSNGDPGAVERHEKKRWIFWSCYLLDR